MADFKIAYAKSMMIEGGYANTPGDRGGETYKGISRKFHPEWAGWDIIDSFKNTVGFIQHLAGSQTLERLVQEFYKKEFWDTMLLDQAVNQDIANEMFDTGVNMDCPWAVEFLQKALNATNRNQKDYPDIGVDRQMGTETLGVLNGHPRPNQVLKLLNCQQGVRYIDICRNNPSQEIFMSSWLSRVTL